MPTTTALVTFLLVLFCTAIGFIAGKGKNQRESDLTPIGKCPCGHSVGEHLDGLNCQADISRTHYDSNGTQNGREWVACPCTRYYGVELFIDHFRPNAVLPPVPEDS